MADLSIDADYLRTLIVKVRAFMGKELTEVPDEASNAIDDPTPSALQDQDGDLSREEVVEEIRGLEPQQLAELVALMWLGRDDGEPEDWDELVSRAVERREGPTEDYLLAQPLLAEYWLEGMERLGLGGLMNGSDIL